MSGRVASLYPADRQLCPWNAHVHSESLHSLAVQHTLPRRTRYQQSRRQSFTTKAEGAIKDGELVSSVTIHVYPLACMISSESAYSAGPAVQYF